MPEFTLYFISTASTSVTVEAGNLEDAIDAAYSKGMPSFCAQCAGWGKNEPGIELSDVWELDEKAAYEDYPEV